MTVWSTPVPPYLQGQKSLREGDFDQSDFAASQTLAPGVDEVLSAEGARVPVRRHSLGAVPSASRIEESKDKWLEFAPTSPQRRSSFVTEPGAIEGNPFDIYKEPDSNNDGLVPNTFYSAGASYSVNERPVMISSEPDFSVTSSPSRRAPLPAPMVTAAPYGGVQQPYQMPQQPYQVPLAPASNGVSPVRQRLEPISKAAFPSGNPFDVPLSPVRYNKPAPKVVLSPSTASQVNTIFSDLDPFKRAALSPRSSMPLEQIKRNYPLANPNASAAAPAMQQQQQPQGMPAQFGWGAAPFGQQQQQQQQQGFGAPFGGAGPAAPFGVTGGWGQPFAQPAVAAFAPAGPVTSFGFPSGSGFSPKKVPLAKQPSGAQAFAMQPWSPKKPNGGADDGFGFNFDAAPASSSSSLSPFKAAGPSSVGGGGADGFLDGFDPVRQKSMVENSFNLDSAKYFGEDEIKAGAVHYEDDEEEEGDGHGADDDDDGSMGEGVGFEVQDDQFLEEGADGTASRGYIYDVVFTAPTQFGMLLERKDEWTRGEVKRRERTVVTLVVEGGEAESKGVSVGSLIVSINGTDVVEKTYKETLEMVKDLERPMKITFERESPKDEIIQGYYFVSKGPFFSTPMTMAKWKRKYVVLGGPIAKKNVLQVYDSKKSYHATVVALFQRRRPTHRVKTYALTYAFKCTDLQERRIEGNSAPLKIFTFMTPSAKFKSIRIASESRKNIDVLFEKIKKYVGKR